MKKVLLLEAIHGDGVQLLRRSTEVRLCPNLQPETVKREVSNAEAIIVRSIEIDRNIIEAASRLKVIGRHGAGVDNIDLETASARKIAVVNTPTANSQSVAEHVVLSMLVLTRKAISLDQAMRAGAFSDKGNSLPRLAENLGFIGGELWSKTLGVIGLGRIGRKVADICRLAFSMPVLAYDPFLPSALTNSFTGIKMVDSLESLLPFSDFITLHIPLSDQTRNLIGFKELASMKKEAFLINAARGAVVNEAALVEKLRSGGIAGAAIDVFTEAPPSADHPFFQLKNVFVTPHVAAITTDALKRMAIEVSEGVLDVLFHRHPRFLVNPSVME